MQKYIIQASNFRSVVNAAAKSASLKGSLPVLANLLFVPGDGCLLVTGSDEQQWATLTLPATLEEGTPVPFCLPVDKLTSIVGVMPTDIDISLAVTDKSASIDYFTGQFSLTALPADEYPTRKQPEGDGVKTFTLPSAFLIEGLAKAVPYVANDDLRPQMNGVFIDVQAAGTVSFVGTDGHSIYVGSRAAEGVVDADLSILASQRSVTFLRSYLPADGELIITTDGRSYAISTPDGSLYFSALCVEGRFPHYRSVFPSSQPCHVVVERKTLLQAVRRASVMGSASSNLIRIDFPAKAKAKMKVSAEDLDFGTSAAEELAVEEAEGIAVAIGFKGMLLQRALNTLSTDYVAVEYSDASRAALFLPAVQGAGGEAVPDERVLVMPMLLNS